MAEFARKIKDTARDCRKTFHQALYC